jgi:hypothetical protein
MATSLSSPLSDTNGCVIFPRLSIVAVSGQPWENFQLNHLVFPFLVAARFAADPIVSLPPYQFAYKTNNIQRADVTLFQVLWMTKLQFARHTLIAIQVLPVLLHQIRGCTLAGNITVHNPS